MKKFVASASGIFAIFLVWIIAAAIIANPMLVPSPWNTARALYAILTTGWSLQAIGMTALRLVLSLLGAALLGLSAGLAAGLVPGVYRFMRPVVTVLRTVPVISIVVIILIIFGFDATPYIITFLMIFPLLFQATAEGVRQIDPELIDVYRLEDDTLWRGLRYCYLPLIAPSIRTAFLQSAGLGVKVLVMAEFLAQTQSSIGNALYLAKVNLDFAKVFAWTILLILMAVGIETVINRYASKNQPETFLAPKIRAKTD
ncbi:MAG: ABC transporter permease subunit [bacterium]